MAASGGQNLLPSAGFARLPADRPSGKGPRAWPSSVAGFALAKVLSVIEVGRLAIELPSGERVERVGALPGPSADIPFRSWRGVRRPFTEGDVGFPASYFDADRASSDVEAPIELGARNGQRLMDALRGTALFRFINWLAHRRNANTPSGSRRNIEAHYDLGNEFYRLWLDARMIYSSAIFPRADATLEQAQQTKLARIVEALKLSGASTVLEIGSGWGGLAATIARAGVARVTGVTISPAQLSRALRRCRPLFARACRARPARRAGVTTADRAGARRLRGSERRPI